MDHGEDATVWLVSDLVVIFVDERTGAQAEACQIFPAGNRGSR